MLGNGYAIDLCDAFNCIFLNNYSNQAMPYLIISVQIRTEVGPTLCGDEKQDADLMKSIGAELKKGMYLFVPRTYILQFLGPKV